MHRGGMMNRTRISHESEEKNNVILGKQKRCIIDTCSATSNKN